MGRDPARRASLDRGDLGGAHDGRDGEAQLHNIPVVFGSLVGHVMRAARSKPTRQLVDEVLRKLGV